MQEVKCDQCKNQFKIETKTQTLENGIENTYFTCPHCDKEYIAFYTDKNIREKQHKLQKMWDKYRLACQIKNSRKHEKLLKDITKLQNELRNDMKILKENIESDNNAK